MRSPLTRFGMGFALIASTIWLAGCSTRAEVQDPIRPAIVAQPDTAAAQAGTIYSGDVKARYESALGFRVGGKIKRRYVDVGAHVKAGDLIAELDPQDLNLQASSARAGVAAAEADLAMAKAERDRYNALRGKNFVSETQFDAVDNRLKAATARATEARAALNVAQNQAGYTALKADQDGVITTITAEAGQVVGPGQTIATLARNGEREVEISVPEGRIANYQKDQPATIELWAESGKYLTGTLREIAPDADATTRTYRVRVALGGDSASVKLGQTARVYFADSTGGDAHTVPLSALYEKDGKPAVWKLDPATRQVHLNPVTVAAYREQGVVLQAGVEAKDWIVIAGVHKLREGQAVNPVDQANKPLTL
ncbi:efflux RND transporter periplasmic adaptor subunit [Tahibacter amnicola]|uniref:Efflux RND transporter periplasmic adaptor subunit n=1 Tax=Tahibacter amnicola TaxID=2976241 RepID=A0ABY6BKA6_9GAMM|nr:efflux RND transporter periplasmic adaptor subunit [Tahibacter amnicola]UXI69026.1 efflux RND transporter periplasmic adaptor subunit [Tahibacter amnicola]